MIYATGDTHGNWEKLRRFADENPQLTKTDLVIVAGDFGGVWSERTLDKDLKTVEELPFTVLFADGNHENFDLLNSFPVTEWQGGKVHIIKPNNIIHLMRGQVYELYNGDRLLRIAVFGGADSSDKELRLEEKTLTGVKTWWPEETITDKDILELTKNLRANGNVDYFLSHSPSATLKLLLGKQPSHSDYMVREAIVVNNIHAKTFICGHEHIDIERSCLGRRYKIVHNKFVPLY